MLVPNPLVPPGLFEPEELQAQAIAKIKEAKINFLEKIISYTAFCAGEYIPTRPSKIVAGRNPEETNLWLQYLGVCVCVCVRVCV